MKKRLWCLVLAAGLSACARKTVLTLDTLAESDLQPELHRLLRFLHLETSTPLETGKTRVRVTWEAELPEDTRAKLRRVLDRAITLDAVGVPVRFELVLTEDDPDILGALALSPGHQHYPLELALGRGEHHVRRESKGAAARKHCTYDVPVTGELPVLWYRVRPPAGSDPHDPRFAVVDAMSQHVLTVKHQTLATPGALQALADDIQYQEAGGVTFVFRDEADVSDQVLAAYEMPETISACADTVLDKASDDFFRVILFPELSRALSTYTLEDRRFVGGL